MWGMTNELHTIEVGTRVKYIGPSIQVAERGELGTVIGTRVQVARYGSQAGTEVTMMEVAWDAGASSYCWPIELEVAR